MRSEEFLTTQALNLRLQCIGVIVGTLLPTMRYQKDYMGIQALGLRDSIPTTGESHGKLIGNQTSFFFFFSLFGVFWWILPSVLENQTERA